MLSIALVMLAMALTAASCGVGGLEKAVKKAFIDGDTTQACYEKICDLIKENPKSYAEFVTESGDINVEALGKYINEIGSKLRPPMTWDITGYGLKELTLTIYFERSGSMTPYDTPGGGGQLKKAVTTTSTPTAAPSTPSFRTATSTRAPRALAMPATPTSSSSSRRLSRLKNQAT